MEAQHEKNCATQISDIYNILPFCIKILQCNSNVNNGKYLMEQFIIRILMCEMKRGIMARQLLKDSFCCLLLFLKLPNNGNINYANISERTEGELFDCQTESDDYIIDNDEQLYKNYELLMVHILHFFYIALDFSEMWFVIEDQHQYWFHIQNTLKNDRTLISQYLQPLKYAIFATKDRDDRLTCLDIINNQVLAPPETDGTLLNSLHSFLLIRYQFAQILQRKCMFILKCNRFYIKIAVKLLMKYPLNEEYGYCLKQIQSSVESKCITLPVVIEKKHKNKKKNKKKVDIEGEINDVEITNDVFVDEMRNVKIPNWKKMYRKMLEEEYAQSLIMDEGHDIILMYIKSKGMRKLMKRSIGDINGKISDGLDLDFLKYDLMLKEKPFIVHYHLHENVKMVDDVKCSMNGNHLKKKVTQNQKRNKSKNGMNRNVHHHQKQKNKSKMKNSFHHRSHKKKKKQK